MTQAGNMCLAAYMLLRRSVTLDPVTVIGSMLALGAVALAASAALWDTLVFGACLPLMALTVIAGGVGCTSNVTYWTFLLMHPPRCTVAASVGMSLGGVLVNALASLQFCGVEGGVPRFGPSAFYAAAAALQLASIGCFLAVHREGERMQEESCGMLGAVGEGADCLFQPLPGAPKRAASGAPGRGLRAAFCASTFALRGITYLMPTLMPYVAGAYPPLRQQLLFWMLLGQQVGETAGRGMTPSPRAAAVVVAAAAFVFAFFVAGALSPPALAELLPSDLARALVPALGTFYFLAYGMLETALFRWIRDLSNDRQVVEDLSAAVGFLGQLGSLTSTFTVFLALELRAALVGGH